jgi:hypothetical protein
MSAPPVRGCALKFRQPICVAAVQLNDSDVVQGIDESIRAAGLLGECDRLGAPPDGFGFIAERVVGRQGRIRAREFRAMRQSLEDRNCRGCSGQRFGQVAIVADLLAKLP